MVEISWHIYFVDIWFKFNQESYLEISNGALYLTVTGELWVFLDKHLRMNCSTDIKNLYSVNDIGVFRSKILRICNSISNSLSRFWFFLRMLDVLSNDHIKVCFCIYMSQSITSKDLIKAYIMQWKMGSTKPCKYDDLVIGVM